MQNVFQNSIKIYLALLCEVSVLMKVVRSFTVFGYAYAIMSTCILFMPWRKTAAAEWTYVEAKAASAAQSRDAASLSSITLPYVLN